MMIFLDILLFLFLILAVYDTVQSYRHGPRWAKPCLMVVLAIFYISYQLICGQTWSVGSFFVIFALLCGSAGDHLLEQGEKFFAAGLGSFLAGHILYILAMIPTIRMNRPMIALAAAAAYLVIVILLVRPLLPHIDQSMRIPVWAYMIVLVLMSYLALLRWLACGGAAMMTWTGSICFIISDTILAYHVFAGKKNFLIMETYILAQLMMTLGFLLA